MPENDDTWELQQEQARQNNENNQQNTPKPLDKHDQTTDNLTMDEGNQVTTATEVEVIRNQAIDNSSLNLHTSITIDQQRWYSRWYDSGVNAKKKGFTRTSPFYERPTSDYFFYCGFDGVKFEDAVVNLDDAMKAFNETALKQEQSNG